MKKWFGIGGIVAGLVLVAFGIGAIAMSVDGRNTVRDSLAAQGITATPDAGEITATARSSRARRSTQAPRPATSRR